MPWTLFFISAAIITFAAMQLAKYGDAIALRTRLGGAFVGTLLIASVTSLPELLTTINSVTRGYPELAAGNIFGSNMINMLILAILDLMHHKRRILRKAAMKHALSGTLAVMLIALGVFFIIADIPQKITIGSFALGIDSIVILLAYGVALSLIRNQSRFQALSAIKEPIPDNVPKLWISLVGFGLATGALVIVTPWMISASADIAEITGLGTTFIGSTLVALVTSIPELVTTLSAARIGADDMAISNLFGSNMFNVFTLGIADFFYTGGRFFAAVDPSFLIVGMLGLIMTLLGLIGNLARIERRFLFIEIDALLLILIYLGGTALLYFRGINP
jgi:cation:H+ antiporter